MSRLALLAILGIALSVPVLGAEGSSSIYIIDFLVDGRSYMGKEITIRGCHFGNASAFGIDCLAFKENGSDRSADWLGTVIIDGPTLDRESLRRALRTCTDFGRRPQCTGDITGTVYDPYAELGVRGNAVIGVKNASITWTTTQH